MATTNPPKLEPTIDGSFGLNPNIKAEPGSTGVSPAAQSEEDIYEDTGDLDFTDAGRQLWLCRLPKFLWENWSTLDDDDQVQIGTVRIESDANNPYKRVSLRLNEGPSLPQNVPKDYVLEVNNRNVDNTYAFTERDLPGYKPRNLTAGDAGARSYLYEKTKAESKTREERKKRWEPYSRKSIPKHTAIVGAVQIEANCIPVQNAEYRRIMDQRAAEELKKRLEISQLGGPVALQGYDAPRGSTFIRGVETARKKTQDNKAARIPENELLDIIISKFGQYKYWSFKNLKAEIRQPEAYLKQTLEKVARQIRNGDFAGTWTLKNRGDGLEAGADLQKAEAALKEAKDEAAPEAIIGLDGADDSSDYGIDEDDENVEMEDVKL